MGVDGQLHFAAASRPGERPVPTVQEVGWAPWSVWTGAKNLPPGFDPRTVQLVATMLSWPLLSFQSAFKNLFSLFKLRQSEIAYLKFHLPWSVCVFVCLFQRRLLFATLSVPKLF